MVDCECMELEGSDSSSDGVVVMVVLMYLGEN